MCNINVVKLATAFPVSKFFQLSLSSLKSCVILVFFCAGRYPAKLSRVTWSRRVRLWLKPNDTSDAGRANSSLLCIPYIKMCLCRLHGPAVVEQIINACCSLMVCYACFKNQESINLQRLLTQQIQNGHSYSYNIYIYSLRRM